MAEHRNRSAAARRTRAPDTDFLAYGRICTDLTAPDSKVACGGPHAIPLGASQPGLSVDFTLGDRVADRPTITD
jgi:hypothetical protein